MSSVVRSVTERRESGDGSGGGSVRGGGGVASERGGVSRRTSARRSRCEAANTQPGRGRTTKPVAASERASVARSE